MLEIRKISKIYETDGFKQKALDNVSVNFRTCEFTSILGPSGSGKTTFLNIIGGLDHYSSGDLIINEISTKKFKDGDWDSYRNHRVGFVFQNYNLITHQSVLSNVKLALTLSGISKKEATALAIKALKDVGLEKHINKRPNQLSGGQMQRVAIARAIVNNPDIILADEPTGALDSETSVQIMKLLKKIAKNKLVIMVTHNPELAKKYSNRIITLKDGKITTDSNPYDGKVNTKESNILISDKSKKTSMSFKTALGLSFNNLMTKKGRTVLVSFAGSIGIIGIALILAVSTGFQNYMDSIQEDTLTSYPLIIMQESTDVAGMLLSIRSGDKKKKDDDSVVEKQYMNSMMANVSANDLRSFKKYISKHMNEIENDVSNIMYSYSVSPNIYTVDSTSKIVKVNPNNLFDSMIGSNSIMNSYSSMASIFSQMVDNVNDIKDDYAVLAGRWSNSYDELMLVLSEPNAISDLLIYSLGLRDVSELTSMVNSIMNGESVNINNTPMQLTYSDLLNVDLRLVMPSSKYKYNDKYNVYEDMSTDDEFMRKLYDNATKLKIVGIVSPKDGSSSMALNPGIAYTSDLVNYIIDYASESEIVKKQLLDSTIDIFSGNKFDSKKNNLDMNFTDLVKVDNELLKNSFNINIDKKQMENMTEDYMDEISNSISADIVDAKNLFRDNLKSFIYELFDSVSDGFSVDDINLIVDKYLNRDNIEQKLSEMMDEYAISKETFKTVYSGLLDGILQAYINGYNEYMKIMNGDYEDSGYVEIIRDVMDTVIDSYLDNVVIDSVIEEMAETMIDAFVKRYVLSKIGDMTSNMIGNFASSFNVNQDMLAAAFTLNFSEDELMRVVSAMLNPSENTQKSNLISLGYQDREDPTYMSIYFSSFYGKENFLKFVSKYNDSVSEDKVINYSDATGILMSSVRSIVDAISYVLIAFVSISLVVSSIMIGIITFISVYERTKEIGVLRSIGASKRNISSIFNAETFIIGLLSGLFGIWISYALIPVINAILYKYIGNIPFRVTLNLDNAMVLIVLSVILTLIGGLIPAHSASKKDPVEALRSE